MGLFGRCHPLECLGTVLSPLALLMKPPDGTICRAPETNGSHGLRGRDAEIALIARSAAFPRHARAPGTARCDAIGASIMNPAHRSGLRSAYET
jgi:hypothetical protein